MNLEAIKTRIKIHEGYRDTVYEDSLGKATIGYGHLVTYKDKFEEGKEYPKEQLEKLFDKDFDNAKEQMDFFCKANDLDICDTAKGILIEMIFQLGIGNVNKFKAMTKALKEKNYKNAGDEMIASKWYSQTKERCQTLADLMRNCDDKS
jgi:lysozyme